MRLPHVSTGDLLRDHVRRGTRLGLQIKQVIERGKLVADDLVLQMLRDRLLRDDWLNGFILDGFPRNRAQAQLLDTGLGDLGLGGTGRQRIVRLVVSEAVVFQRRAERRTCTVCGKTFRRASRSNDSPAACDVDGSTLAVRADDRGETIRTRLDVCAQMMPALVAYYQELGTLIEIDAERPAEDVRRDILAALDRAYAGETKRTIPRRPRGFPSEM